MTQCCENCAYARKAYNKDYVGCVAMTLDEMTTVNWFRFYDKKEVGSGWVYLRVSVDDPEGDILTNGIPCFKKDDCCKNFKPKKGE